MFSRIVDAYRCFQCWRELPRVKEGLEVLFAYRQIIRPDQIPIEIVRLIEIVRKAQPRTLIEIGTCDGGTLFLLATSAAANALLISIDLPGARFGGGYSIIRKPLYKSFARQGQRIRLIRDDSHLPRTLKKTTAALGGDPVDFLFLDGDHTYEGVRRDFEMYAPLVKPSGIVAFHDIVEQSDDARNKVYCYWNEIKQRYRHQEIIQNPAQDGYGIGVLYV